MQISVLNGSPKGEKSVTMQYVRFLELTYPDQIFTYSHIGKMVSAIEKKPEKWDEICSSIRTADLILWATPVYFQHVPSQLKRFIEMIAERQAEGLFTGKFAASLSTSVHFFDHAVHEYLQGISEDWEMAFAGSFSAAMNDLFIEENQRQLVLFGSDIMKTCREHRITTRASLSVPSHREEFVPGPAREQVLTRGKRVLILHDATSGSSLDAMVRQAGSVFSEVTIRHLDEMGIKGGCLGCVQCAFDNTCVYSDGFVSSWKTLVEPADIIIMAGTMKDRYLSSAWKRFFDRSFFLGHIPRFKGKQLLLMVSGPLASVPGLRANLSNLFSGGNLVDIITDESPDSATTDAQIWSGAERSVRFAVDGYEKPPMFPEVAGHIVLRDAIWSDLRPIFRADHRYYKKHGLYDFPQYQYRKRLSQFFFSLLMGLPQVQKKVKAKMTDHMIESFSKIFSDSPLLIRKKP